MPAPKSRSARALPDHRPAGDESGPSVTALLPDQTFPDELSTVADRLDEAGIEDRTATSWSYLFSPGNGVGVTLAVALVRA